MSKTFIAGAVCRDSRVRIGGAGGRRNVRPCHMQKRTVQFSEVPWKWWYVAELFVPTWSHRVPDS